MPYYDQLTGRNLKGDVESYDDSKNADRKRSPFNQVRTFVCLECREPATTKNLGRAKWCKRCKRYKRKEQHNRCVARRKSGLIGVGKIGPWSERGPLSMVRGASQSEVTIVQLSKLHCSPPSIELQ